MHILNQPPQSLNSAADGTVAAPSISFLADQDTGIYRIGANNIGVAANGAKVLDVSTTGLSVDGVLSLVKNAAYASTIQGAQIADSTGNSFLFKNSGEGTLLTLAYDGTATFAGAIAVSGAATFAVGAITSGLTDILVNPTTKTSGNLIDAQLNGISKFRVSYTGSINLPSGGITMDLGVTVGASARITWLGQTEINSSTNGTLTVQNSANNAGFVLNGTTDDTLMLRKRSNLAQDAALTAGAGTFSGAVTITGNVGFYGQAATAKPTGVAVSAAAIHAALVTLNLIAA